MSKKKTIRMLTDARGAPEGHTVVNYPEGWTGEVNKDLADVFIANKQAVETKSADTVLVVSDWPPSEGEIALLSFSALGVLLEQHHVSLGYLKGVESRQEALRDIIKVVDRSKNLDPSAWPLSDDALATINPLDLRAWLYVMGEDVSRIDDRDEAVEILRKLAKKAKAEKPDDKPALPTDAEIDAMDTATLGQLLVARSVDVDTIPTPNDARAKLKDLVAQERAALA